MRQADLESVLVSQPIEEPASDSLKDPVSWQQGREQEKTFNMLLWALHVHTQEHTLTTLMCISYTPPSYIHKKIIVPTKPIQLYITKVPLEPNV